MFKELMTLIKDDPESQKRFKELEDNYFLNKEHCEKEALKRSRIIAVILAMATIISILFFVYAFEVKNTSSERIEGLQYQIEQLESKLETCQDS